METTKSAKLNKQYLPIVITICIGLLLSVLSFVNIRHKELMHIEADFNKYAWDRINLIQRELENHLEVLQSVYLLFISSESVTRDEFQTFCKSILSYHPDIQALEWIPRVTHSQREDYEKNARSDGYPDFQITRWEGHGKMVREDYGKEYLPVYYVEPYKGNEAALGFDMATNPTRLRALNKARDTGEMTATERIMLVQEKGNQYGFLAFLPVYHNQALINTIEGRRDSLVGFTLGVFRTKNIVEELLMYLEDAGIDIYLFDKSSPQDKQFIYSYLSRTKHDTDRTNIQQEAMTYGEMHISHTFNVADRKWSILCKPVPEFIEQRRTWYPWGFLFGGLLFTGLLIAFLRNILSRTEYLSQRIIERTEKLSEANEELQKEITNRKRVEIMLKESSEKYRQLHANSFDCIIIADTEGRIAEINNMTEKVFGYDRDEMFRINIVDLMPEHFRKSHLDGMKRFLRTGKGKYMGTLLELEGLRKNGEIFPIELIVNSFTVNEIIYFTGTIRDITERKRTAEMLNVERQRLFSLLEELPAFVYLQAQDYTIRFANRLFKELFGDPKGEFCHQVFHKQDGPCEICPTRRVFEAKTPQVWEWTQAPNGRIYQVYDYPFTDVDGSLLVLELGIDITERKELEQELHQSRKHFSTLAKVSPVGIYRTGIEGHCSYVNEQWCKISGSTVEEALGEGWSQKIHPEDCERISMLWQQSVENKSRFEAEYRFLQPDKKTTWVLGQATPEIGENGEVVGYVGTITDITDRKRIETRLRESEQRFRELAENINEVFWITSHDLDDMIYVSPAFKAVWGYSCKSLYEQPRLWNDSIHPEERENVVSAIAKSVKDEKDFAVEYRIIRQDKEIRWIHNRGFLVRNEYGKIYRIAGIAEDITERKLAEKQIQASLTEKEVLLKEIHHRVKNNMQVISSLIKFQSENIKEEKYAEMFKDCQNRIRTMSLIHEKLYRSEDISNIKMDDYVKSLANEIFRSYRKSSTNVRLKLDIEDISIGIESSIPCGLVINELISNSLKYAFPEGREGEIKISLRRISDCGLRNADSKSEISNPKSLPNKRQAGEFEFELVFSDNGVGMPKDLDYRNAKSLGLRLIVNLTEHQLGGKVELDRSKGTEFRIRFRELKYKKRM